MKTILEDIIEKKPDPSWKAFKNENFRRKLRKLWLLLLIYDTSMWCSGACIYSVHLRPANHMASVHSCPLFSRQTACHISGCHIVESKIKNTLFLCSRCQFSLQLKHSQWENVSIDIVEHTGKLNSKQSTRLTEHIAGFWIHVKTVTVMPITNYSSENCWTCRCWLFSSICTSPVL